MHSKRDLAAETRQWAPSFDREPQSIFGNFAVPDPRHGLESETPAVNTAGTFHDSTHPGLQSSIDEALARSFLYRWLAQAFEHPSEAGWRSLTSPQELASVDLCTAALLPKAPELSQVAAEFKTRLAAEGFAGFHDAHLAAFGHAARGICPLNEIEYGDIKADPLFQPHRLADLAAFYLAFGLEVAEDAGERQDHICLELEFMCVLAAKEAYALEHQLDQLDLCHDAQKRFLREHLGRWAPAFARRLARATGSTILAILAGFLRVFVESEGRRFGVRMGSEDLMLRPVDGEAERLCAGCGK